MRGEAMTAHVKVGMSVDEYLTWAEGRPGRYELVEGKVFTMAPERARHARIKLSVHLALAQAVRDAGLRCEVLPDGMAVRIDARTAFEPDGLVYCGERLPGDALEVPHPVIVIEVLSPSTGGQDTGTKLAGYFRLPSVAHYLIIDPVRRTVIHHRRAGEIIETRIVSEGALRLDPPGLEVAVADMLAEP